MNENYLSISKELSLKARDLRKKILTLVYSGNASHIGSMYSCIDILTYLYYKRMNFNKSNYKSPNRDRLILSKGHSSLCVYTILNDIGILPESILNTYYQNGGKLMAHMDKKIDGVEVSTGSLGHGLSIALGICAGNNIKLNNSKVYCVLGDGECNEGSVWEALILLSSTKFNNLVIIIDSNKLQGYDYSKRICEPCILKNMLKGTGLNFYDINGHSFKEIAETFYKIDNCNNKKPHIIFANTIKGKGLNFMENKLEWHYKSPNKDEYIKGINKL